MKKLYYFPIMTYAIAISFIVSCSSESPKPQAKTYSSSTMKEFEAIEKSDVPSANRSIISPRPIDLPSTKIIGREAPIKAKKEESTKLIPADKLSPKSQERLQEINQNLAFYCMKHRNDSAFSSEEKCLKFTQTVLNYCEKRHKIVNTVMVNCIKDKLKKRH